MYIIYLYQKMLFCIVSFLFLNDKSYLKLNKYVYHLDYLALSTQDCKITTSLKVATIFKVAYMSTSDLQLYMNIEQVKNIFRWYRRKLNIYNVALGGNIIMIGFLITQTLSTFLNLFCLYFLLFIQFKFTSLYI